MMTSCIEYLEATALRFPDKTAIVDEHSQCTFRELRERALLLSQKIPREWTNQPIAVYLPKNIEALVAFMGILYSGNFYVPLDLKSPAERIQRILRNLAHKAVITNSQLLNTVNSVFEEDLPLVIAVDVEADHSEFNRALFNAMIRLKVIDTDPVYCIYTSGSTGEPKGVLVSHRGVIDYIEWAISCYSVSSSDVIGSQSPLFFDNSTLDIYLMASTGATLCLISETLFSFPVNLISYLRNIQATVVFWVPSVMLHVANHKLLDTEEKPPLQKILFAGEVMPCKTLNYWRKAFPGALFSNLYGPTEITVDCTYYVVDREFNDSDSLPIGIPCRNTDILVLDQNNQRVSGAEVGELCVRGSSLALGYWNDREKTDSVFVQNPLNLHYPERIYRTGDLVQYNERGELIFLGRKDSQIKHAGYRIELGEIETAILGLAVIDHACVLYWEEKKSIVLFFVSSALELSEGDIRKNLVSKLPKYMIPTIFRRLDVLPLNPNGKIDRLALKKML